MKQEVKFIWERVQVQQLQPTQRGARSLHLGDFSPKPKPGVSSAGLDDTTAVAKCKGAPPPSAHAQKGYLVSNLSSSGVSVQTRYSRLVWPLHQNKTVLLRRWSPETVNGGGWGGQDGNTPQKIPLAIFSPFCFMRGSVELATFLARTGRPKPRFFSTKS